MSVEYSFIKIRRGGLYGNYVQLNQCYISKNLIGVLIDELMTAKSEMEPYTLIDNVPLDDFNLNIITYSNFEHAARILEWKLPNGSNITQNVLHGVLFSSAEHIVASDTLHIPYHMVDVVVFGLRLGVRSQL